jgi:DNA-directed RNA polymerase specialized sigma24 family protein
MASRTRRAQKRNIEAYFKYADYIKKTAKHTWIPGLEAADIESEITMRLLTARITYKGTNNASEATYVRAIIFNAIKDLRRKVSRHPYIAPYKSACTYNG